MRVFLNILAYGDLPKNRDMPSSYLETFQAAFLAFALGVFQSDYKKLLAKS